MLPDGDWNGRFVNKSAEMQCGNPQVSHSKAGRTWRGQSAPDIRPHNNTAEITIQFVLGRPPRFSADDHCLRAIAFTAIALPQRTPRTRMEKLHLSDSSSVQIHFSLVPKWRNFVKFKWMELSRWGHQLAVIHITGPQVDGTRSWTCIWYRWLNFPCLLLTSGEWLMIS